MSNKRNPAITFVFEYKTSKKKAGATVASVEKEAEFRCLTSLATDLGIVGLSTTSSSKTITVPAYEKTPTRSGGIIQGSASSGTYVAEATTIPVQSHKRVVPHKLARGRKMAIVTFTATNLESKGKTKGHRTGRFVFPSAVTITEINIALSMLFNAVPGILSASAGGTAPAAAALILPYWIPGGGSTRYTFITDKTRLTELEAAFGVKVALSAADAATIEAGTGGTTTPS